MSQHTAAVIGCGKAMPGKEGFAIGHNHANGYRAVGGVDLCAVDPDDANRKAFAETFGVPEARCFKSTADLYAALVPEVVSICTWPHLHAEQTREAAKAGVKGILCEKPMALDPVEAQAMHDVCKRKNVKLAITHQRVYDGVNVKLKELLHAGAIGEGWCAEMRVDNGWDMLSWSVHWMDLVNWLYDAMPDTILAGCDHTGQRRYRHAIEDGSVVLAEYPNSRQAIFVTGPDLPDGRMVSVRGTEGLITVDGKKLCVFNRDGYTEHQGAAVEHGSFAGLVANMFGAIDHDEPLLLDAERSKHATMMAWAAHESARTMRRVTIPLEIGYAPLEVAQHPPRRTGSLGRVVIHADAHHADPVTGEGGREGLLEAMQALGAESVEMIKVEDRALEPGDLESADLLLLYHTQRETPAVSKEAIDAWVKAGKPLGVIHCGIGAYPDWPEFRQWMGRHWVWGDEPGRKPSGHPHEPCELKVLDPAKFATGWDEAWLPRDEVYVDLHDAAPVHELVTGTIPEGDQSIAWQSKDQPNVAVWAAGHRKDIWNVPTMREGLDATIRLVMSAAKT